MLLKELRAQPGEERLKRIADFIGGCCMEYWNVRKAVEKAFARPLTDKERELLARLHE